MLWHATLVAGWSFPLATVLDVLGRAYRRAGNARSKMRGLKKLSLVYFPGTCRLLYPNRRNIFYAACDIHLPIAYLSSAGSVLTDAGAAEIATGFSELVLLAVGTGTLLALVVFTIGNV